ncbi:MAG: hypothetical protein RIC89_01235 [Pseudomonadales bacterium]
MGIALGPLLTLLGLVWLGWLRIGYLGCRRVDITSLASGMVNHH